jgi:Fe-S cluster assembly protein SufD
LFHQHWQIKIQNNCWYIFQLQNKEESLTSLNTAFANEGAYINIPKSKVADRPNHVFLTGNEAALVQPRNLIL